MNCLFKGHMTRIFTARFYLTGQIYNKKEQLFSFIVTEILCKKSKKISLNDTTQSGFEINYRCYSVKYFL